MLLLAQLFDMWPVLCRECVSSLEVIEKALSSLESNEAEAADARKASLDEATRTLEAVEAFRTNSLSSKCDRSGAPGRHIAAQEAC